MPASSQLREAITSLATLAGADLGRLWRQVSTADEARAALMDTLPSLVETYGLATGAVAADFYDDLRDERNIAGRFTAAPATIDEPGTDTLTRWGLSPLFAPDPDWPAAQALVFGGLQRRIANAARDTVMSSALEDPRADGWQRDGTGSCDFCTMLIARGAVYSDATADFGAHDNCSCIAVPAFTGRTHMVKPFTPSIRGSRPAGAERARAWIAANT